MALYPSLFGYVELPEPDLTRPSNRPRPTEVRRPQPQPQPRPAGRDGA